MDDHTIDGDAVELGVVPRPDHSADLVRRERRSEVIRPMNADALADSFREYQALLPKLLDASDWQHANGEEFVKKSGWRKISAAFDLDVFLVSEHVERDANGRILRSKAVARAIAPSGRTMEGDGYCTIEEFTGKRAANPKLENDLRGTAATRAKNRAISDLVGMGKPSAEEVSAAGHAGPASLPEWAEPATQGEVERMGRALAYLLDGDLEAVVALAAVLSPEDGPLPRIVFRAIGRTAAAVKAAREAPSGAQEPTEPAPATDAPSAAPEGESGPDVSGWPDAGLHELVANPDASDALRERASAELERRHAQDTPPSLLDDDNPDLHTL